ncbi:glycosyl transferase family protein [Motiliproteus sediminis]|uniref:glycosyl transferase family protein n=1 Tax=Motiliproteus sediminis TaxID=1468178 RepID=UPI001AF02566|nr:glycosyl transferase family protein [Motiliproteus sediminis]
MNTQEHPFAPFVRVLGKGKKGSRSLTQPEAREAMGMILDDQVRPEQLGAFLMLLRVKEESPDELAGFVQAVRERMGRPLDLRADVDWSTYAGKKNHLPWFLLSALTLSASGRRVVMHGAPGHTAGRIYVEDLLGLFGLHAVSDWAQTGTELDQRRFAYVPLRVLSPKLDELIQLRPILGLRSPVHTLCRVLNPLDAEYRIDGVFHPAYGPMHQRTAMLLHHPCAVTVRGDGGEAEIKPDSDCSLQWVAGGEYRESTWPRLLSRRLTKDERLEPEQLLAVWRGEAEHPYGEAAVQETLAVMMVLMGEARAVDLARVRARELWQGRDRSAY